MVIFGDLGLIRGVTLAFLVFNSPFAKKKCGMNLRIYINRNPLNLVHYQHNLPLHLCSEPGFYSDSPGGVGNRVKRQS